MKSTYRPDIDGLRALAVSAVVGFHAFPNLVKGGFVGVDIFFVISGFLISRIILTSLEDSTFSYLHFYKRRIQRIVPALILVCVSTLAVGWYVLMSDEFVLLGTEMSGGAAFLANFVLWSQAGYFDPAADTKPLLHLWSLAIEEQFYVVWPVILSMVSKRRLGAWILTLGTASFIFGVLLLNKDAVAAFYSPFARIWELLVGAVLAHTTLTRRLSCSTWVNPVAGLGVLVALIAIVNLTKESKFPGWWALLPTAGAVLLLLADGSWFNRVVLSSRLAVYVGKISYPLYLWHWPVLVFFKVVKGSVLTPSERAIAVTLALVLAHLTWRFVERRVRHSAKPHVASALVAGLASVACVGAVAHAGTFEPRLRDVSFSKILLAGNDWQYPPPSSNLHSLGALRYSDLHSARASDTLFLGDSHMEQYGPRIEAVIRENPSASNGAILVGNQRACSLVREIMLRTHTCDDALELLEELIGKPSTQRIVLSVSWLKFSEELQQPLARKALSDYLARVAATKGKRIYILLSAPAGPQLAPKNMFTGSRLSKISPKPIADLHFDPVEFTRQMDALHFAVRSIATSLNAVVIDPLRTLCTPDECPIFDSNGRPLYLDTDHMTRAYVSSSASYIDLTLLN
ncbi:acyltransferase family protein [Roseateles sp. NT4]|uniref:acyltransferase family protein n=1 Tax=Roseateles sp. NT4 TaxID=3453715 RepID=UPI003EEEE618